MDKKRIIFFGSGDFPRETFEQLTHLQYENYEVVGLVTSHDKCEDEGKTLKEIAYERNIPYIVVKDCNDENLEEWCKNLSPDIFIVISFKKIPNNILSIVGEKNAFNIHASLLPFLRGANPIRWAIRHKFTKTGLTAIELSDKIDCGNIIANMSVGILEDDNYGSLKKRLASVCPILVFDVLDDYYVKGNKFPNIVQYDCGGFYSNICKAPKLNSNYYSLAMYEDLSTVLRSLLPYNGLKCTLCIDVRVPTTERLIGFKYKLIKTYSCTLWGAHKCIDGEEPNIEIYGWTGKQSYSVDEIQIEGKKRMSFDDFKNGFKYLKPIKEDKGLKFKKYVVYIKLLPKIVNES